MSTRCQIGIYEKSEDELDKEHTLLYRHCDGYPENPGALEPIVNFTTQFIEQRGWDVEYLGARLLTYLIYSHTQDLPNSVSYGGCLSYGICKPGNYHGDIEYYYAIYPDRIEVYSTPMDAAPKGWKKIQSIKIKKEVENEIQKKT